MQEERRIIFSSNFGDPKGREFDLWAIDSTGANLERVTTAPRFDGFPMFSPASGHLALASNRATPPGQHDTNVFVARWDEKVVRRYAETPADRILADIRWLAAPEREGFDLLAWVLPIVGLLASAVVVTLLLWRWTRRAEEELPLLE